MRRVLIDLRMVRGRLHGIARYALELARRLPPLLPEGYRLEGLTGPDGLPANLGPLRPDIPLRRSPAIFLSMLEQPLLAASLVASGCDLFHATSFSVPVLWPGRLVATLHDANHLAIPEEYGPSRGAYYRLVVGPRARRADAVIAPSDFSRSELARLLDLNPYKIQVIREGVAETFHPPAPSEVERFRARSGLPPRYFVAVGNVKPYKNLSVLARIALDLPVPIVLLTGGGAARAFGFPSSAIELGEVAEEDLPLLYGGATALLLPSRYEGFGLPALEAMACGCPVVAARAGSLPEVVGEAAIVAGPDDAPAWRDAALLLLRDEHRRSELVQLGFSRAAHFRWEQCAVETCAVYRRVLSGP